HNAAINLRRREIMICPSCKTETQIQEEKTQYIYPNYFIGMPTFWGFMNPSFARMITIIIAALGIIMAILGTILVIENYLKLGITMLIILPLIIYTVIVGIISLNKYRIKKYYKCLSCRLEWYGFVEEGSK
ncbi:MAG: hypothetical protein WBM17_08745, partial [Anaerolineales bacterium]